MIGTCFFNHPEVTFKVVRCPVCAANDAAYETQAKLESKIEGLEAQIVNLEESSGPRLAPPDYD